MAILADLFYKPISGEWGEEAVSDGVQVIRTTNFTNSGKIDINKGIALREISDKKIQEKRLIYGDVIVEKSGGSPEQPVGRVVFFDIKNDVWLCNNFTSVLRPKQGNYPKYCFYGMYYLYKNKAVLKFQNKTTGIINLKLNDYLINVQIFLPPFETQKKIADVLDKAQELIDKRKEQIQKLDEFVQSVFWEMFGDFVGDNNWNVGKIIDFCIDKKDIKCGPFGTQLNRSEYKKDGIPLWGIPQINSNFKNKPVDYLSTDKAIQLDEYSVIPFDILMSRKGTIGKCSLYPSNLEKGIMHSDVLRIRVNRDLINPVFLCYQLRFCKQVAKQIEMVSDGAIMAGINVGKLKSIIVFNPPYQLQNQFAQIVEKTEQQKTLMQQSLTEMENNFNSIMQRAFKGELFR